MSSPATAEHSAYLSEITNSSGRYADPLRLYRSYAQVYSQHCEDGYIAEIFARIGVKDKSFLEVGIEDGRQNATRLLLEQGWHGYWVEGNQELASRAIDTFSSFVSNGLLTVVNSTITTENINKLLDGVGAPQSFDLLSLDIDQNTSHVWRALKRRSRVACIEYNASLPPSSHLEVPYDPAATWDGTNWFGGSLKALENIGVCKGLSLVACDPLGVNAYFVANDEAVSRFAAPFTAENHYEPPRYHLTTHIGHRASSTARRWVTS